MPRNPIDRTRVEAVDQRLRAMFAALESRPIPDRLLSIVDQMDDGADQAAPRRRAAAARVTSG